MTQTLHQWELPVIILLAIAASTGLTHLMIRFAPQLGLIDIPNHRSSHSQPTPRGGGVAFMLTFFICLLAAYWTGVVEAAWVKILIVGGGLVSVVGLLDDRKSMPARLRLAVHFAVALITYAFLTNMFSYHMTISFLPTENQFFVGVFCVLYISWMINLYNFMDGIDGLAATQGVLVSLLSAGLSFWQGSAGLGIIYLLIAASLSGFLYLNWAPAKIFMGDCGAYFLGFTFAALALMTKVYAAQSFHAHMIILGVFIADATFTLAMRAIQGKQLHKPHRSHAFQQAVQKGLSHRRVALIWNAITLFWLAPMAMASVVYADFGFMILMGAYLPLLILMVYLKAGIEKLAES